MVNKQPFTVASIEFNPRLNNLDDNIRELMKSVTEAAENGAKLIVTPEMATTGYHYESPQAIKDFVDTIPGKTTVAFEEIARRYHTHIVIGMAEVDEEDQLYYNSAALVGPDGYIGKYRKMHLWAAEENWASWGNIGVPVYETAIGKVAMIICMDSTYFESARIAAVNGADILCFPTNSTGGSLSMLQSWAEMNGMYVIGANRSNTEKDYHMIGASAIWSPTGEKLAETPYVEQEEARKEANILYAEVHPLQYDNAAKRRLQKRRPGIYRDLMLYTGPWNDRAQYFLNEENQGGKKCSMALLQYEPEIGDRKTNLEMIKALLHEATKKARQEKSELSLVVCPELSLSGPVDSIDVKTIKQLGETVEDETVEEMKKLARQYSIHLVFGMIERDRHLLYNTVFLFTPTGEMATKARKIHLTESDERWATPGEEVVVTDIKGLGRVGLMVGYDAAFPEIAGGMAVKQANMMIIPSSWYGEYGENLSLHAKMMENKFPVNSMTTWDATARFSQAITMVANFIGTEHKYKGGSAIYTLDPLYGGAKPVVASSDKEEAFVAMIPQMPSDWWFDQRKLLLSRRADYYRPLVMNQNLVEK
ncbi:carbon-nitrogen hydrolase family protein [Bacillus sp. FJAT-42315]|uniref:carbon-nitrogen hydrolase family protein n=1 Tax=Bacillus sp. FJAT-42315 TaxID=2014077 RepID=UPI000C249944|nr:carbon-nitrogen hydrolase family protein [Bacillus sp. FJAT-42315]